MLDHRFKHFLRCCTGTPRVRSTDRAGTGNGDNGGGNGEGKSGKNGRSPRPNCTHLFLAINGVSKCCTGRVVGVIGSRIHNNGIGVKEVSLLGGFSFVRIDRSSTDQIVGNVENVEIGKHTISVDVTSARDGDKNGGGGQARRSSRPGNGGFSGTS